MSVLSHELRTPMTSIRAFAEILREGGLAPDEQARFAAIIGDEARSKISYVNLNNACLAHDTLDRLGEITCPTLIMAGAVDPVCSMTATRWMQDGLPQAETVIFQNSSHFFLIEESD